MTFCMLVGRILMLIISADVRCAQNHTCPGRFFKCTPSISIFHKPVMLDLTFPFHVGDLGFVGATRLKSIVKQQLLPSSLRRTP